jgi:hypothetical protein
LTSAFLFFYGAEGGIVSAGVAQVIDGLGNPLFTLTESRHGSLFHLVFLHLTLTRFVVPANTVLTPAVIGTPRDGHAGESWQIHAE